MSDTTASLRRKIGIAGDLQSVVRSISDSGQRHRQCRHPAAHAGRASNDCHPDGQPGSARAVLREAMEWIAESAAPTIESPHDRARFERRLARVRDALDTEPVLAQSTKE